MPLDLAGAPPVLFLYGLAGAGKNYAGDLIGRETSRFIYHADIDLTAEMRDALAEKKLFTIAMLDTYFVIVADRIHDLCLTHPAGLVVTQATYRHRHSDYLRATVPGIDMVCVTAADDVIVRRLVSRGDMVAPDYAELMKVKFEAPQPGDHVIVNNAGEHEVLEQFGNLYGAGRNPRSTDKLNSEKSDRD